MYGVRGTLRCIPSLHFPQPLLLFYKKVSVDISWFQHCKVGEEGINNTSWSIALSLVQFALCLADCSSHNFFFCPVNLLGLKIIIRVHFTNCFHIHWADCIIFLSYNYGCFIYSSTPPLIHSPIPPFIHQSLHPNNLVQLVHKYHYYTHPLSVYSFTHLSIVHPSIFVIY